MILVDNLSKSFKRSGQIAAQPKSQLHRKNQILAVKNVSFKAADGGITGLLGPNGAGKSTTLRMLATLIKPDSGTATIDGNDIIGDVLAVRNQLGFMPHNAGIYPRLTARENIMYYALLCGLHRRTARERAGRLIEQLGMSEFADRRSAGFSQGQKTKVALARALAHQPHTVMLDEPTNGLDVMATRGLREIIRQLASEGHCIVFSSHIMQEVAALCDHIAIISSGTIAIEDSLENILTKTGQADLEDAFVVATQSIDERSVAS